MRKFTIAILLVTLISCKKEWNSTARLSPAPDQTAINQLKLNQIQVMGSHNSYHKHMDNRLFSFLQRINFILPSEYKVEALDYAHEPLDVQLNTYALRSFELDIYADPQGGRFYKRQGNFFAGMPLNSNITELQAPGYKIMHIPDIDYETHFYTFKSALSALKLWSDAHPNHLPVFILIEGKEQTVGDILGFLGFTTAIKFTPALTDQIDDEIKSVFGNDLQKVITPDKVRGSYTTLKAAALANNWPTIGDSRGKFIFIMQGESVNEYVQGHPNLENRAMFVQANENNTYAAFIEFDDPIAKQNQIINTVQKNYIVRTRADEPNHENRTGNYDRQNKAFISGAQIISTDYYRPDARYLTNTQFKDYQCKFPDNAIARINPVSAADKLNIGKIAE